MKKVAIVQSNYIPWKGYFDMIAAVDEFILYDDMQFTKNDWRNRNQVKTPQGVQWLTIPVGQNINRRIRDVTTDAKWQPVHWKTLVQNYRRAAYFKEIAVWLEPLYLGSTFANLSQTNRAFIEAICEYLSIRTIISNSWDYNLGDGKTERLADLCAQAGGTEYISGPAAKDYIDEGIFRERKIELVWFDYGGYPEYQQLWGEFTHGVTILDLLFHCGPEAGRKMKWVGS
ncbi:WbqC family protein [Neorhizobium galegae]|uniref:WbqC family protein n=1 Tax=Neorhizobium galegae TaxID=399 RepID=UPI000620EDEB|nr:WbqC family protein [Neorhizobium galegae]MCQ1807430.1 WbqC family protein [Neorhizobium galegae]CDZ64917.1 WbqC-like protein [Neorhizobium galegae bv. orientalis]